MFLLESREKVRSCHPDDRRDLPRSSGQISHIHQYKNYLSLQTHNFQLHTLLPMHLPVLHEPDDRLRAVSQEIDTATILSPEMQKLVVDLKETMQLEDGIGIAAPQVGMQKRVIIVDLPDRGPTAFFNPRILERSFKMIDSTEGCLSVPECSGLVKRHRGVTVHAWNAEGVEETLKVVELSAIIFQHEIDHLDGILFIDRAEKIKKY